jgi:hypothetical protein
VTRMLPVMGRSGANPAPGGQTAGPGCLSHQRSGDAAGAEMIDNAPRFRTAAVPLVMVERSTSNQRASTATCTSHSYLRLKSPQVSQTKGSDAAPNRCHRGRAGPRCDHEPFITSPLRAVTV